MFRTLRLGVLALAALACHEAPARRLASIRDTGRLRATEAARYLDPNESCGYLARDLNPDPVALVGEYTRRDNGGEFLQSSTWLDSAYVCPNQLPGPDAFTVVANSKIVEQQVTDTTALVLLRSTVLGTMGQDSAGFVFERRPTIKIDTFVVTHTPYGWRLLAPGLPENVLASWVLSHPERVSLRDSSREALVQASLSAP